MKEQSAAYLNEWEKDLNGVSNPKLRAKAQKRMTKVQKNYDNAAAASTTRAPEFAPFLSDLADIQKVLANDLTEGGLKSLRRTVSSAEFNQGTVRRAINAAALEWTRSPPASSRTRSRSAGLKGRERRTSALSGPSCLLVWRPLQPHSCSTLWAGSQISLFWGCGRDLTVCLVSAAPSPGPLPSDGRGPGNPPLI